jgi:hypothetical protein
LAGLSHRYTGDVAPWDHSLARGAPENDKANVETSDQAIVTKY